VEEIEQGLHRNSRGKVDFGPPVHGVKPTTTNKKRKRDGLRITGADGKSKKLKKDQETRINAILAEQSSSSSDNDDNKSDDSSYVKVDELLTKFRQMDIKVNRQTVNKPSVKLDLGHALEMTTTVNGVKTSTCIDTGAGGNAVEQGYIEQIAPVTTAKLEKPVTLTVATNQTTKIEDIVLIPIEMGTYKTSIWCLVVKGLSVPLVLGMPSMKRLGMIIDTKHSLLKFHDSDVQVKINKCSPYTQVHTECRARKACMLGTAKI
jgi:hypothetical protein